MFGSSHSLILPFDYANRDTFDDFEEQLTVLRQRYRFAHVSEVVARVQKRKRQGLAVILFENPRQGVLNQALPVLVSLGIPFMIFLDPDYVGLNRLPLFEELAAYRRTYPENWTEDEFLGWQQKCLEAPNEVDSFLMSCRARLGPLPIERLDPLSFFCTWGKLLEINPEQVEFGLSINERISSFERVRDKLQFSEIQLKRKIQLVRSPKEGFQPDETEKVRQLGIQAIIGHRIEVVDRNSSLVDLPIWKLN
ncbi:MAG: hypothetical protein EBQ85_02750 [Proteobacteria bacterium]|nr:hypothetical protein [Pseudomonadota bacterium]